MSTEILAVLGLAALLLWLTISFTRGAFSDMSYFHKPIFGYIYAAIMIPFALAAVGWPLVAIYAIYRAATK